LPSPVSLPVSSPLKAPASLTGRHNPLIAPHFGSDSLAINTSSLGLLGRHSAMQSIQEILSLVRNITLTILQLAINTIQDVYSIVKQSTLASEPKRPKRISPVSDKTATSAKPAEQSP
jgi:hypothetical protein